MADPTKRKRLRLGSGSVDDDLVEAAHDVLRAMIVINYSSRQDTYNRIVAIHEARKAIRRQNARKRKVTRG